MLKNLVTDIRLGAMDVISEVKNMAHDMTTTLPDEKVVEFKNPNEMQNIQGCNLEYMNNNWNQTAMQNRVNADRIDMVGDKIKFIANLIINGLIQFDSIEDELKIMSSANTPPSQAQLLSLASRIDSTQKQVYLSVQQLQQLVNEMDKATDSIQVNKSIGQGWSSGSINAPKTTW